MGYFCFLACSIAVTFKRVKRQESFNIRTSRVRLCSSSNCPVRHFSFGTPQTAGVNCSNTPLGAMWRYYLRGNFFFGFWPKEHHWFYRFRSVNGTYLSQSLSLSLYLPRTSLCIFQSVSFSIKDLDSLNASTYIV